MATRRFINSGDSSNKFWEIDVQGRTVHKKWGRIGGHVSDDTKEFPTPMRAESEAQKQINKKIAKGYREVQEEELSHETEIAESMGSQYKIENLEFVGSISGQTITFSDNYDPEMGVFVTILHSHSKRRHYMTVTKNQSRQYSGANFNNGTVRVGPSSIPASNFVQGVKKKLSRLAQVVAEAVNTIKFAAVGARSLEIDGMDDVDMAAITAQVESAGQSADSHVIQKFAALGNRTLDL